MPDRNRCAPARTPEARETELIALAMDLAERQMREGTASSQIISHYLKLGAVREQLEIERLQAEIALSKAKVKAIESGEERENMYKEAIAAMVGYTRHSAFDQDYDDE